MDFGTLLSVAQRNENSKQNTACYQTKFAPPKKTSKQSKALSDNIKKFLARKEEEERQKALEEKKKKENLLALRDHKAQSRINKHLKVCKAANKSVLADAIDNQNTAVTIAGPSQPDEDDYGYVSQEASAFYNQLMNKYNSSTDKPLFSDSGKKTIKDIASTKDRVKQALKQQVEDSTSPRRRKKSCSNGKEPEADNKSEKESVEKSDKGKDSDKNDKPKPKKRPPPPPMDFGALLKLAEKKQYEPIIIEAKPKVEEPERLMTKKQMKEYIKEKEWKEKKEQRKNQDSKSSEPTKKSNGEVVQSKPNTPPVGRIPKLGDKTAVNPVSSKSTPKPVTPPVKKVSEKSDKSSSVKKDSLSRDNLLEERKKLEAEKRKLEEMRRAIEEEKKKLEQSKAKKSEEPKPQSKPMNKSVAKPNGLDKPDPKDIKPRQFPPNDLKSRYSAGTNGVPKQFPPSDVRPKQFPPPDVRPKQFPPPDVRPLKRKLNGKDLKGPPRHKRRIYDDDDEEYDSELDDFIDDGPEDESADYSKYISEIFGYDKSKYRHVDDDDDAAMESNFAQQLKEEYVSTKIGIMEDLEDIRMEALEKKRKALLKKKGKKL